MIPHVERHRVGARAGGDPQVQAVGRVRAVGQIPVDGQAVAGGGAAWKTRPDGRSGPRNIEAEVQLAIRSTFMRLGISMTRRSR